MSGTISCYDVLFPKSNNRATFLQEAFQHMDETDGKLDGKFVEPVSGDVYTETSMDLCHLAEKYSDLKHGNGKAEVARFVQTGASLLSLVNLIEAKKDQGWPVRAELINLQIGFAYFLNTAIPLKDNDWFRETTSPLGTYRFWEPALKKVISKEEWIMAAKARTLPSLDGTYDFMRCGDLELEKPQLCLD